MRSHCYTADQGTNSSTRAGAVPVSLCDSISHLRMTSLLVPDNSLIEHEWSGPQLSFGLISNPKQPAQGPRNEAWRFYAAYSFEFVRDYLRNIAASQRDPLFLDPWNGSGSTTTAAWSQGFRAIGIDLNPAMNVIATARVAKSGDVDQAMDIVRSSVRMAAVRASVVPNDPLSTWFEKGTVGRIRAFERATVGRACECMTGNEAVSAVLYLVMFRVLRHFVGPFLTSNPTWIRMPKNAPEEEKVKVLWSDLRIAFAHAAEAVREDVMSVRSDHSQYGDVAPRLLHANAKQIPLAARSVDHVVSSPPYGTRIDYAVATAVECAALGIPFGATFDQLRSQLTGTTKVPALAASIGAETVGEECFKFLQAVRSHPSRASGTYYLKNWETYFIDIAASISEVSRVLKRNGTCTLIVQDSFYKDIRAPIQEIFVDICKQSGLRLLDRFDFPSKRNLAAINKGSRRWRAQSIATESVLRFAKL